MLAVSLISATAAIFPKKHIIFHQTQFAKVLRKERAQCARQRSHVAIKKVHKSLWALKHKLNFYSNAVENNKIYSAFLKSSYLQEDSRAQANIINPEG